MGADNQSQPSEVFAPEDADWSTQISCATGAGVCGDPGSRSADSVWQLGQVTLLFFSAFLILC